MNPTHAPPTKNLNGKAIDAAELAVLSAEFAPTVGGDPPGFESDEFFEKHTAFGPPQQQGIVLTQG